MKTCECCRGLVPDYVLVSQDYTTASQAGTTLTREVCVVCREWLPVGSIDCYASPEWHRWRERQKKVIRRMWGDLLDAQVECPDLLTPPRRSPC